ncbi:MAG: response regulator [Lachnospiraceae bacterium]
MYRILVADDEPIERRVVSKKIKEFFPKEVEVITAENGKEAVEKFTENQCHIAILDIEMPGMTGLEAAKIIRDKDSKCSIIFLTAFDEFSYAKKAIEVKALDYLLKPGGDEELQSVLEEALSLAENNVVPQNTTYAKSGLKTEEMNDNVKLDAIAGEIRKYIDNHYTEDISLQHVAGAMGYSDAYFCKLFKQCFDKNFITYLNDYRIKRAIELLNDISESIRDISSEVGYRDANYFARIFKRNTGLTPSEYRNKIL